MVFNRDYVRTPPGIAKIIALGLCIGAALLAVNSLPSLLQEQIVDSVWKEVGLLYVELSGIVLSLTSIGICLATVTFYRNIFFSRVELFLYFCTGLNLLIFGGGTLQSTLSIHGKIGDCCEKFHDMPGSNCTLHFPGLELEFNLWSQEAYILRDVPYLEGGSPTRYFGGDFDMEKCTNETAANPWRCNMCLNRMIQPKFLWKGASGAMGIITSIFFEIVVFVGIKSMLEKKVNSMPD